VATGDRGHTLELGRVVGKERSQAPPTTIASQYGKHTIPAQDKAKKARDKTGTVHCRARGKEVDG
jgi:hypothetical protein